MSRKARCSYEDAVIMAHRAGEINAEAAYRECYPHRFSEGKKVTYKLLRECAQLDFFDGLDQLAFPDLLCFSGDEYVDKAKSIWANDDCEIAHNAKTSMADEGCWVQAWVWVSNGDMKG